VQGAVAATSQDYVDIGPSKEQALAAWLGFGGISPNNTTTSTGARPRRALL